jgi:hypothetical protein
MGLPVPELVPVPVLRCPVPVLVICAFGYQHNLFSMELRSFEKPYVALLNSSNWVTGGPIYNREYCTYSTLLEREIIYLIMVGTILSLCVYVTEV